MILCNVFFSFFCCPRAKTLRSISFKVLHHWLQESCWDFFFFTNLKQPGVINTQVCLTGLATTVDSGTGISAIIVLLVLLLLLLWKMCPDMP